MIKIVPVDPSREPTETLRDLSYIAQAASLIFIDDRNPQELGSSTTQGLYCLLKALAGGIMATAETIEEKRKEFVTIPEMNIFQGKKLPFPLPKTN